MTEFEDVGIEGLPLEAKPLHFARFL